nr:uncharacterized protein LOC117689716 [Crassostrea gigas]
MSIFLKSERDKPYLISLQLKCSRSTYYNVQVNLEGNEGTVKFQMRQSCTSSYNWNHAAFSDKDIGDLQRVRFMNTSGTEPIKGIQVRTTSQNRRRNLRYRKTGLHSVGNEIMFTMDNKEEKPAEYDIYPTQFSLLSKNHPRGSFVRRRDTVFVEVVSAIKRESFWGKPATHLLSHKNSMVTIEEKTPVPFKRISALVEERQQDTRAEGWNLKLSENEIQTYPYLSVITTQYNVSNFDVIFENLERTFSVDSYRVVVPLMANKRGCMIDDDYIQTYLMTTDEIEGLKFENTSVSLSWTSITVTTSITAMNKDMYEQNMPALDSILRMAVQQYPCNEGRAALFVYRQSSEEMGLSTVAIVVIAVLASIIAALSIVLGTLACLLYRRRKNVPPPSESRPMVEANRYVDESEHTDVLYTNKVFDAQQDRLQGSLALPPRSRRQI